MLFQKSLLFVCLHSVTRARVWLKTVFIWTAATIFFLPSGHSPSVASSPAQLKQMSLVVSPKQSDYLISSCSEGGWESRSVKPAKTETQIRITDSDI